MDLLKSRTYHTAVPQKGQYEKPDSIFFPHVPQAFANPDGGVKKWVSNSLTLF